MMYKSEKELREVISLRKGDEIIDFFLESYLQGLEFEKWKVDKDLEATEEIAIGQGEDGNDIVETKLVNVYESIDVSELAKQWKLDNYQILREPLYPKQSEYLDAMVKGDELAIQLYKDKCLAVKSKYPKEQV